MSNHSFEEDFRLLKAHIGKFVAMHATCTPKELHPKMAESLTLFVVNATCKFDRGQREHGGDFLRDVDMVKEMAAEQLDFFWYNEGARWQRELRCNNAVVAKIVEAERENPFKHVDAVLAKKCTLKTTKE